MPAWLQSATSAFTANPVWLQTVRGIGYKLAHPGQNTSEGAK